MWRTGLWINKLHLSFCSDSHIKFNLNKTNCKKVVKLQANLFKLMNIIWKNPFTSNRLMFLKTYQILICPTPPPSAPKSHKICTNAYNIRKKSVQKAITLLCKLKRFIIYHDHRNSGVCNCDKQHLCPIAVICNDEIGV